MVSITIQNLSSQSFINELEDREFNSISGGLIKPTPWANAVEATLNQLLVPAPLRSLHPLRLFLK